MKKIHNSPSARYAIYVRSATNNKASLAAQEQKCRAAAATMNPPWTIAENCVFSDDGASGVRCNDRPGLAALLQRAAEQAKRFEYVLVSSTDRLGRSLAVALPIIETLARHGVGLYFVDQMLDSKDPHFRMLLSIPAMMEEKYISALRTKVRGASLCGCSRATRQEADATGTQVTPTSFRTLRMATAARWGLSSGLCPRRLR